MTTVLYVVVFFLCLALTIARLVDGSRRKNLSGMISAALITVCVGLFIPPVYEFVDPLLVRTNAADLLSKTCLVVGVALLGSQCARAMNSPRAIKRTVGPSGSIALGAAIILLFATFAAIPSDVRSPRLEYYAALPASKLNSAVIVVYVVYVLLAIIGPTAIDARRNPMRALRISSALLAFGFLFALVRCSMYIVEFAFPALSPYTQVVAMLSVGLVVSGATVAWFTARRAEAAAVGPTSFFSGGS